MVLAVVLHAHPAVRAGPQPHGPYTSTGSPGANPVAPGPSFSTQPAFSWPSVKGSAGSPVRGRLHEVQVGVAGAGPSDLDQDLPRPWLGNCDLTELAGLCDWTNWNACMVIV